MKFFLALLAGASLAALPVAFAGAQNAAPTPCSGVIATDPAGDDTVQPLAVPVSGAHSTVGANPNVDIRTVFLNYRANVLTGYLKVKNLSKAVPEGAPDDVTWWVEFDRFENGVSSLKAVSDGTEVKFYYGTQSQIVPGQVNNPSPTYTETTGQFIEGADGVVAIDLPAAAGLKAGNKLTGVYGMTTYNSSSTDFVSRTFADRAPDDGATSEKTYTLTECPAEPAPGGDSTGGSPPPSQQQPPPPQQEQGTSGSLPASGPLTVSFAVDKGKRKTALKRGLRARVRCSVQCKVKATATITKKVARKLKLGKKAVKIGTGKASITTAGRIPFQVKLTKKAKKALKRKGVKKFALKVAFSVTDNQGKQLKKATKKSTLR